jgi:UDP-N-acetylmuramate--alanine ligase
VVSHLGKLEDGGQEFYVGLNGRPYGEFRIGLPGRHNVSNALAAIAVGHHVGVPVETMKKALAEFRGAGRRFELVGEAGGVTVMDDYAHHPTELCATIAAARERFAGRRLVAVFQPHTYSRTLYLLEGFRNCFEGLDELLVLETYAAREPVAAGMSAEELSRQVTRPKARFVATFEDAAAAALVVLRPGDVFFTLGAGDVNEVGPLVLEGLRKWKAL